VGGESGWLALRSRGVAEQAAHDTRSAKALEMIARRIEALSAKAAP